MESKTIKVESEARKWIRGPKKWNRRLENGFEDHKNGTGGKKMESKTQN